MYFGCKIDIYDRIDNKEPYFTGILVSTYSTYVVFAYGTQEVPVPREDLEKLRKNGKCKVKQFAKGKLYRLHLMRDSIEDGLKLLGIEEIKVEETE